MAKLFEELKRRKVVRVAGVYAVVAWLLIQVANNIVPALQLPAWTNTFIVVLLLIGFPVALVLAWAFELTPEGIRSDSANLSKAYAPAPQQQKLIYAMFVLLLIAVGFQIADRFLGADQSVPNSVSNAVITEASNSTLSRRFSINIGNTAPFGGGLLNAHIALSADGSKLVYGVLRPGLGAPSLNLKHLDQLEERELFAGVAYSPFFSPDGEWVGFSQDDSVGIFKVPFSGGAPQLLTEDNRAGTGGFWSVDGTVFYTSSSDFQLGRISESGGAASSLGIAEANSGSVQSWPYLLPGDDALLYTVASPGNVTDGRIDLWVQSSGEVRTLIQNGYNARYVPTGHLVFVRAAALWAVPFDAERLQTTGPERPVIQGIQTNTQRGETPYAFSEDGLLVYLPGGETNALTAQETTLVWVDRDGNEEILPQARNFGRWAVSPDGRQLAVSILDSGNNQDIWVYDLARQTLSRLTFDNADDRFPVWTPDGERIVFHSTRDGGGLWWRAADGTGAAERLLADAANPIPYAFTPDGAQLLYNAGGNIYTLTPGAEVPAQALIQSEFGTIRPDLSPDGRWLAYQSNETGRFEIYVRPFPNIDDGKWQISSAEGESPKWSPDGLELFFSRPTGSADNGVWVAQRDSVDAARFSAPVRAFTGSDAVVSVARTFDISADGSRILLRSAPEVEAQETEVTSLVAVENWFAELRRLAPPGQR
jgi:eukaryotic-like serine/threonine-protein kinase